MIGFTWFIAAHYCNWLSQEEGLPSDQWCYIPNEDGAYGEGMTIPANVLDRTGYRLPTEAEWEYACRAGAVTSRYYGHSNKLLKAYAWYRANSAERAWMCGSLFPNDLGLFDMLGNEYEWCQERWASLPHLSVTGITERVTPDPVPPDTASGACWAQRTSLGSQSGGRRLVRSPSPPFCRTLGPARAPIPRTELQ